MSARIRVVIRADAGQAIGTGHFARASAVADALLASGNVDVVLATGTEGAELAPAYFSPQVTVITLGPHYTDPAATMQALREHGCIPSAILLDQYGEVPEWERQAANDDIGLLVIDDLDVAERADIIIRPHGGPAGNGTTKILRGPTYVPLSSHITACERAQNSGVRLRLNVCFGGSDPTGETAKAIAALASLPQIDADVVIGPRANIDPEVIEAAQSMPHVKLHHAPSQAELAQLMASADLALGAGGVMLWERMYLGVPSLVISVADNQNAQIDSMVDAEVIELLGGHLSVTPQLIISAIMELAADPTGRKSLAEKGRQLVDGHGARRIAAWLRALTLNVRPVVQDDAADLLAWRKHEANWRHNWNNADPPTFPEHEKWLAGKLSDPSCHFSIIECRGEPVGVVRFDLNQEDSAYLSIYLVPSAHGKKLGLPVLFAAELELCRRHPEAKRINSHIHRENPASERLHMLAGFQIQPTPDRPDWLDAVKELS